jgi:hypothetical protein
MMIDLNKRDIVSLVMGTSPSYSAMDHPLVKATGRYYGGFSDEWVWDQRKLTEMSESDLLKIYRICLDSWDRQVKKFV